MAFLNKKFITELVTPFNLKAMIDYETLSLLANFYIAAGADGFFVNTFGGEMYSINENDRLQIAQRVTDAVKKRVPVYATGSFGISVADKADFAKKIFDTGIDAVLLVSSHYANVDAGDDQLLKNFETMCRLTRDIPFGIYEGPVPYRRIISADLLKSMIATDRVVNIVDGSADSHLLQRKTIIASEKNVELFESFTPGAFSSLRVGAAGLIISAGLLFPEIVAWLCEHALQKEKEQEVVWLQQQLNTIAPDLEAAFPLNVKYFLKKRGLPVNAISRSYSFELTPKQKTTMERLLSLFYSWCETLHIQPVDTDELRIPSYPLDPAV